MLSKHFRQHWSLVVILVICLIGAKTLFQPHQFMAGRLGDPQSHAYILGWFCPNFFQHDFHNPQLFYPTGVDMSLNYEHPLLSTLTCPLKNAGIIAQYNALVIIQLILIIGINYWFISKYTSQNWLKLTYVLGFGFSSFTIVRLMQHANMLTLVWAIPLTYQILVSTTFSQRRDILFVTLVGATVSLSSWITIPVLLPLCLVITSIQLIRHPGKRRQISKGIGLSLMLTTAIFTAVTYPTIASLLANPNPPQPSQLDRYNIDVLSFIIPWREHFVFPIFQNIYLAIANHKQHYFEQIISLDPLLLILLLSIILRHYHVIPNRRTWYLLIGTYFVLAIGTELTIAGVSILKIPLLSHIHQLPLLDINRAPGRYGLMISWIIAFQAILILNQQARYHRLIKLIGIYTLVAVCFFYPHPISSTRHIDIFPHKAMAQIAQDPQSDLILNLPLNLQDDQSQSFLSNFHTKPTISATVSYLALKPDTTSFIDRNPLLSHLSCHQNQYAYRQLPFAYMTNNLPDQEKIIQAFKEMGITHLILNNGFANRPDCQQLFREVLTPLSQALSPNLVQQTAYYQVFML